MRLVAYHRWVLVVTAVTLAAGSQMFTATEGLPLRFFLAWLVAFFGAAVVDHRRHMRAIP